MFESQFGQQKLEKIKGVDISTIPPCVDGTKIIMQRHEEYIRDRSHERSGSLTEESAKRGYEQTTRIMREMLSSVPENERADVVMLVIASNTQYAGKGRRSYETATQVIDGIKDVLEEYGLNMEQLMNTRSGVSKERVLPTKNTAMQEPQFLDHSPEFVTHLKNTYGDMTQKFWQAYEEDWEKEKREEYNAEGPAEMAERYKKFMGVLTKFAEIYHKKHPGKRLIIWPVSHYDTVSPYIKNEIEKREDPNDHLPVDFGGGVSVEINEKGEITSSVQGKKYIIE